MLGLISSFAHISGAYRKNFNNKFKNPTTEKTHKVVHQKLKDVIGLERVMMNGKDYEVSKLLIDKDLNIYAPIKENNKKARGFLGNVRSKFDANHALMTTTFEGEIKGTEEVARANLKVLVERFTDEKHQFFGIQPFEKATFIQ